MKTKKKKSKPNPQDATLRNIRSLKKRLKTLEDVVKGIGQEAMALALYADEIMAKVNKIESSK